MLSVYRPDDWILNYDQLSAPVVSPSTVQVKCDDKGTSLTTSLFSTASQPNEDQVSAAERWLQSTATSVRVGWVTSPTNNTKPLVENGHQVNGQNMTSHVYEPTMTSYSYDPFDMVAWHTNSSTVNTAVVSNPFHYPPSINVSKSFELNL